MTDHLEDRLRRAFEAHAAQISHADLDSTRREALREQHSTSRFRWAPALFATGGLAAAAVAGAVVISGLDQQPGRSLADPPMAGSTGSTDSAPPIAGGSTPSTAAPDATSPAVPSHSSGAPTARSATRPSPTTTSEPTGPLPQEPSEQPAESDASPTDEPSSETSDATPEAQETAPPQDESALEAPAPGAPAGTTASAPVTVRATADTTSAGGVAWRAQVAGPVSSAASGDGLMGYQVSYGDGRTVSRTLATDCDGPADAAALRRTLSGVSAPYQESGTYRVTVVVRWCSPGGRELTSRDAASLDVPAADAAPTSTD